MCDSDQYFLGKIANGNNASIQFCYCSLITTTKYLWFNALKLKHLKVFGGQSLNSFLTNSS
jgi:hypothetical protein